MVYYPDQHHRRTIRLREYDYATPGAYFVTICAEHRRCLFGEIVDSVCVPNGAGQMVRFWCEEVAHRFPGVRIGEAVVMPNHLHAIFHLGLDFVGADLRVCPPSAAQTPSPAPIQPSPTRRPEDLLSPTRFVDRPAEGAHAGAPLPQVVQWFKTMTTNAYIRGVRDQGWARFDGRLWQRNYYEHVLRDEERVAAARRYIAENPTKWGLDPERPR